MYSCPACGADDVEGRTVCRCGADVTLLQRLDSIADAWFNRALEALAEGRAGRALEWLSACCAARPTDAAARRAQARVWAQLGRYREALDALERAAELDPTAAELPSIREALDEAQQKAASKIKAQAAPARAKNRKAARR